MGWECKAPLMMRPSKSKCAVKGTVRVVRVVVCDLLEVWQQHAPTFLIINTAS